MMIDISDDPRLLHLQAIDFWMDVSIRKENRLIE